MILLLIKSLTFICVAYGVYCIMKHQYNLASYTVNKVAKACSKEEIESKPLDLLILSIAVKISPYIKLNPYNRKRLDADLKQIGNDSTPEMYQATILTKSGLLVVCGIICLFIIPIFAIGFIGAAIITYFKNQSDLKDKLEKKKMEIEYELPRFTNTIKQELTSNRDVLKILENYKRNAGDSLKNELEITLADMRSGNYEAALLRFEARVSIATLSDIMRGLIGVIRGDDNITFFEMLAHDLDVLEIQRLENIAMRQPGKIKKYLFLLLVCIIIMYVTILIVYTIQTMK